MMRMSSPRPGFGQRLLSLALLRLLLASDCTSVKQADLMGQWTLADRSREYLPANVRGVESRLTFNGDGTVMVIDLPERHGGSTDGYTKTGGGTWRIVSDQGRDRVELTFAEWGTFLDYASFLESPPKLDYFINDPDLGQRIEFIRGR